MASLAATRGLVADAVMAVDPALDVRPQQVRTSRPNDGWVTVQRLTPATYAASAATFAVVVLLSAEQTLAEARLDALAVPLVDALTKGALHPSGVTVEPALVLVGEPPAPMYALVLTLTLEVE